MTQTVVVSTRELKRQADLVFEGLTINVMLCELIAEGFDSESLVSDWQTIEQSGGGYARFTQTVPVGSYDTGSESYKIPTIAAEFTATTPYTYNTVVIYFSGESYVHSIITESPNISLSASQAQTYLIDLYQDD
jgi:hypothetical protein